MTQLRESFYAVPSQPVRTRPWGPFPAVLSAQTVVYSYELDVAFSGTAHMQLMGQGEIPFDWSDSVRRQYAAEGSPVPLIALVLNAVYLHPYALWWSRP